MYGKQNNAAMRPTALGISGPTSTYGSVVPSIYGRTRVSPVTIWAANMRPGPSSKKGKGGGKKKGGGAPPTYIGSVDFLLGSNPIMSPLTLWANQNQEYSVNIVARNLLYASEYIHNQTMSWSDPKFFCVVGVSMTGYYETQYQYEYGNPASPYWFVAEPPNLPSPDTNFEWPLWNMAIAGPDPTNPMAARMWPFCYVWRPGDGPSIKIPALALGNIRYPDTPAVHIVTVYYAQLIKTGVTPASQLNLTYESVLGSGPEYGSAFAAQQILYPIFSGMGSPAMDCGSVGTFPDLRAEVLGSFNLHPSGDCDFADIVEDIFKAALVQSAFNETVSRSQFQRGLAAFEFPGFTQKKTYCTSENSNWGSSFGNAIPMYNPIYDLGSNQGIMIVGASSGVDGTWTTPATVSDDAGHTWVPLIGDLRAKQRQYWYALPGGTPQNPNGVNINFDPAAGMCDNTLLELSGLDGAAFEASAVLQSTGASGVSTISQSITVAQDSGKPCFIVSLLFISGDNNTKWVGAWTMNPRPPLQNALVGYYGSSQDVYLNSGAGNGKQRTDYRIVNNPGTYTFSYDYHNPRAGGIDVTQIPSDTEWTWVLLAFKATQPSSYAKGLGNILDQVSLDLTRKQCKANGLIGSLCMDSQKPASDWLRDLYVSMNAAPVWSGFKLKSIPYSEQIAYGAGNFYYPPTAPGPIENLGADDFIGEPGDPLISVEMKAPADCQNIVQIQHPNRSSNYVDITSALPDSGSIATYGSTKQSPMQLRTIQDDAVARMLIGIMTRRENVIDRKYLFKLNARWSLLEPMDLITISDPSVGIVNLPVRLTSISEDADMALICEAEPFIWGLCAPKPATITGHTSNSLDKLAIPANVNTPIFLESTSQLGQATQAEIWIIVSDSDVIYGGCQLNVSTDGGASYKQLGAMTGNAITGKLVGAWPDSTDPDTTNDLAVDLTESLGVLSTLGVADEDSFQFPFAVKTGSAYELGAYAVATQTATNKYTLSATGGNHLRRGILGTTHAAHSNNDRFAFIGASEVGIFKVALDPAWIGKTLKFKIASVNKYGNGVQDLADCAVYSYAVQGSFVSTFQGTSAKGQANGYPSLGASATIPPAQIATGTPAVGSVPVSDGAGGVVWTSGGGGGTQVKITSADTTADYLQSKLLAGTNIAVTKENAGANEDLRVAVSPQGSGSALDADKLDGMHASEIMTHPGLSGLDFAVAGHTGLLPTANLGTGSANAGSVLQGDQTWAPWITGQGAAALNYKAEVLRDAPLGYWRLGDTTAAHFQDSGSAGVPLLEESTPTPAHCVEGLLNTDIDGAAFFDGSGSNYARSTSTAFPQLTNAFTFELLFRPTAYTGSCTLSGRDNSGSLSGLFPSWILRYSTSGDRKLLFTFYDSSTGAAHTIASPELIQLNMTYHFAVTYDGNALSLYSNGILLASSIIGAFSMVAQTGKVAIGCGFYNRAQTEYASAIIDEFAIYGTALSASRVLFHYYAMRGIGNNAAGNTRPYSLIFNATSDWGAASGGFYSMTINHNLGTNNIIPIIWDATTGLILTMLDQLNQTSINQLVIRIPSSPDRRFAGRIVITGTNSSLEILAPDSANCLIYWNMDEAAPPYANSGSGGTLALPLYSNAVVALGDGIYNAAAKLASNASNGKGYLVTAPTSIGEANSLSVFVWIKVHAHTAYALIAGKVYAANDSTAAPYYAWALSFDNNTAAANGFWYASVATNGTQRTCGSTPGSATSGPNDIEFDQWVHIGMTYNAATGIIKLYKNGRFINSATYSVFNIDYGTHGRYIVGADFLFTPRNMVGEIDELRIIGSVLPDADILALFKASRMGLGG